MFITQGKTNWKFLIIIAALAAIISGGIVVWQYKEIKKTLPLGTPVVRQEVKYGIIEGSLGYPSEGIPSDMEICAEGLTGQGKYCTSNHIKDNKYTYGEGYRIKAAEGDYYVYAILPSWQDYKAFYSEFVKCGLKADCFSHEPIIVKVKAEQILTGIDPQDWYKASENETANWQTYTNSKMGFSIRYPSGWSINEETILSTGVEINIRKNNDARFNIRSGSRYNQDLSRNYYLDEWIEAVRDSMIRFNDPGYTEKIIEFAGQEATEFIFETNIPPQPPYLYREIYTGRKDNIDTIFEIVINFDSTKENVYGPIINQMLSAFRFIDETAIIVNGKTVVGVKDFPKEIKVFSNTAWQLDSIKINNYSVSPNGEWIFISTTLAGVHEIGWLYNIKTKIFSAIVFAFEGGVGEGYWRNDSAFVAFQTAGPKPSNDIKIIYTKDINEYAENNGFYISRAMGNSEIIPHIIGWNGTNLCFKLYDTEENYCINPETKKYEKF